jgi:dihydrodipicolinate synthase/N-acetylneuraminate lyase
MSDRYMIRVYGVLGPLLRITFKEMSCEARPCQSTLHGRLDEDALHHLLKRLAESGVELLYLEASSG